LIVYALVIVCSHRLNFTLLFTLFVFPQFILLLTRSCSADRIMRRLKSYAAERARALRVYMEAHPNAVQPSVPVDDWCTQHDVDAVLDHCAILVLKL
jgi:hypothetical protein